MLFLKTVHEHQKGRLPCVQTLGSIYWNRTSRKPCSFCPGGCYFGTFHVSAGFDSSKQEAVISLLSGQDVLLLFTILTGTSRRDEKGSAWDVRPSARLCTGSNLLILPCRSRKFSGDD